jgi:hypothetical protein
MGIPLAGRTVDNLLCVNCIGGEARSAGFEADGEETTGRYNYIL